MYIKKTNVMKSRTTTSTIHTVQCPYCKTFLESISPYITAMICWRCNKEFRIERDKNKIIEPPSGMSRTMIR